MVVVAKSNTPKNCGASTLKAQLAEQTAAAAVISSNPYDQYYHTSKWPKDNMPFHPGELQIQRAAGVHERVMTYAPKLIRPYMPEQHVDFYQAQPVLVVAARRSHGHAAPNHPTSSSTSSIWATLVTSPTGQADLVSSPNLITLELNAYVAPSDALYGALTVPGTDVGILGIEFATKRRNRVNGRITAVGPSSCSGVDPNTKNLSSVLTFTVDQSFGNCPQYIKPRKWWTAAVVDDATTSFTHTYAEAPSSASHPRVMSTELTPAQMQQVALAETIFVATGYPRTGDDDDDVRHGNDVSHRGGPAGFVQVQDSQTLILPEFAGNNIFNTLGNLRIDPHMGITIPFLETGGMLQLSGTATVNMDSAVAAQRYPGALRLITFNIEYVNVVPDGSLPVRWTVPEEWSSRQLRVKAIVPESETVKSFYLEPIRDDDNSSNNNNNNNKPLWKFTAGQHLPIQLQTPQGEVLRTYSLSGSPRLPHNQEYYRISVKREPMGKASTFLHEHMQVGNLIQVNRPAGDFLLPPASSIIGRGDQETGEAATSSSPPPPLLLLLSNGIGVTPILSMLHQVVGEEEEAAAAAKTKRPRRAVVWVHGARNSKFHPFRQEVQDLARRAQALSSSSLHLTTHVVYSQPLATDVLRSDRGSGGISSDTTAAGNYDSPGHVTGDLVERLTLEAAATVGADGTTATSSSSSSSNNTRQVLSKAHVYMCGNGGFMADMEEALHLTGVNPKNIFFETF
ncbi:hypothetical protein ACA910_005426 [Epithemia clementina (nom. ined.)]